MKIRPNTSGEHILTLMEIEPFFIDLIRRIPESGNPGENSAARERLFSAPADAAEKDIRADWFEFVEPELRSLFRSAQQIVQKDVAALPASEQKDWTAPIEEYADESFQPTNNKLTIPRKHADAWLSALNQARLVIAARRDFNEKDMEETLPLPPFDDRQFDLFRIHFYDYLQEILLRGMGFD